MTPPVAVKVALYGCPAVPSGSEVVVMWTTPGLMVMLNCALALTGWTSESVTCTVKLETPTTVGVPLMTPVLAFKCKPVGKAPLVMLQA